MRRKGIIKYRSQLSIFTVIFFCLTLLPIKAKVVSAESLLKSPVINSDGTVTFNYQGDGTEDKVILKGEFTDWADKDAIVNDKNIWSITLPTSSNVGSQEYGFNAFYKDGVSDGVWKGDSINTIKATNGNPVLITPGYYKIDSISSDLEVGQTLQLKAVMLKDDGKTEEAQDVKWTVDNNDKVEISEGGLLKAKITAVPEGIKSLPIVVSAIKGDKTLTKTINLVNKIVKVDEIIKADELIAQPGGKSKWYIAGSFQGWNNTNADTQLNHLVDGFYEYSTVLDAGDYEFKFVKNGTWDGVSKGGDNFKLTLAEKTKVNFYVNEVKNEVRINIAGVEGITQYTPKLDIAKWPRLVGDIQKVFGEEAWSANTAKQMFVDYNFDGSLYKIQRNIPVGKYEAKVTFGGNWDENYGAADANLALNTVDPADVVFSIDYAGDKILRHNYKSVEGEYDGLINKSAIKFDSRSVTYKKPFGAIKEESEDLTLRIGVAKDDVQVAKIELIDGKGVAKSYEMRKATTIGEIDYYEAYISKDELSSIGVWGYKFILVDGKTKMEYGDDGISGGTGSATEEGALPYNLTVYAKDYKTPDWMKNSIVYQIFPDRFFDGNKDNNRAKLVDGVRGFIGLDGSLKSYPMQYFDGGVDKDPAASQVWGSWSDHPENPRHSTPENKPYYPNSKTDNIWTNEFYGGDIQGIEQKLDYLKSIGVSAIYLNPVSWGASNHKYDATDFKSLDPMFGQPVYNKAGDATSGLNYEKTRAASDRIYQAFTKASDKKGIKLIADGVFNHVGDDSIYFDRYEKYPEIGAYEYWKRVWDKVNDGMLQDKAEKEVRDYFTSLNNPVTGKKYSYPQDFEFTTWFKVENQLVTRDKDGITIDPKDQHYKYEGWWGYDSLPVMEAREPQIGDSLAISGQHEWNNINFRENIIGYDLNGLSDSDANKQMQFANSQRWMWMGSSGWRLDCAPDVSTDTWKKFRDAVKSTEGRLDVNGKQIDNPVILGEEWGVATKYLLGDQFDSVMNYQFRGAIQNYIINGKAEDFNNALEIIRENYPKEAWEAMLNLVDSHDTIRNLTKIDNPTWDEENTKIAPDASDKALKLQALTAIFQMGYPGAPTIYYGDEVGVTGTKDPDSRRTFPWERLKESNGDYSANGRYKELFDVYKKSTEIRNKNLDIFATGDIKTAYSKDSVIAYARKSDSKGGLLVLNQSDKEKTIVADVTGFLPNGLNLKDELYGDVKAKVIDGKVTITIPAETAFMMVSSNKIIKIDKVDGLKAESSKGQVDLTWNKVNEATKYNVYRTNLEVEKSEKVGETTKNSFKDTDVVNGTRYYYYITAVKGDSESDFSDSITVLPSFNIEAVSTPNTVKDLTIGVGNKTEEVQVIISIPGLTDDSKYAGIEAPNMEAKLSYYKDGTSVDNATSIKLRYKEDTSDGKKVYYGSFEPTEVGIYKYFAKATTNTGDSYKLSDEVSMKVIADGKDTVAPLAPVLKDILVESNRVKLEWDLGGDEIAGIEVYRSADGNSFVKVATLDSTSKEFIDYTINNDNNYSYKVSAYDKAYNREYSVVKEVTPKLVMVDVTLNLHIPNYTPATDDIFIAGDLNGWNASGGKLTVPSGATSRDVVEYKFKMMAGKSIQYKYTRGSWGTEAFSSHNRKADDTEDYGNWAYSSTDTNMNLTVKNQGGNSMVIDDYILRWGDMPMMISMPRISYGDNIEYTTDKEDFTLKAKVPFGVACTINDEDLNKLYPNAMDQYGNILVNGIKLKPGVNNFKIHVEPTKETLGLHWYTDQGRAGQATKTINMSITYTGGGVTPPTDVKVTGVVLDKTSATIKVDESLQLNAILNPENATNKNVTWISSDEKVSKVDENGKVVAVSSGKATITVTTKDGDFKATSEIIVNNEEITPPTDVKVTGVLLDKTSETIKVNESLELKATVLPENATNKNITWTSSDEKVAKVDEDGKVVAVSSGKATITVTTKDGDFKATCEITVNPKWTLINRIPTIAASNVAITVGDTFDPLKNVTASDYEDGDLTKNIKVVKNQVDTKKEGEYKVVYQVSDSKDAITTKIVIVTVKAKEEVTPPSEEKEKEDANIPESNGTTIIEKIENPNGKNEISIKEPSNEIRLEIKDIEAIKNGTGSFEIKNGDSVILIPFELIDKSLITEGSSIIFEMKVNENSDLTKGMKAVKKVFEFTLGVKNADNIVSIHTFKAGMASVTLKLSDEDLKGLNKDKLAVFYYNEETKTFEILETTINGNEVTFKTPHFSKFIVAEKITNADGVILPKTGGNNTKNIIIIGLLFVGVGVVTLRKRKSRINN
ncbi:Ig-like domain-containing protein [Clostridium gasigenes]|uniref:Ig-like domain-containing protein n=1 Tax=Clostridium gasigenes TaxID=94869 RepID=UPI001C0DBACD|nr:Ig-like domain-containing protein [Clostridium gasigenes]MBU3132609.1 Ig-like domain-containing protein [Clostridium gasigenes]